MVIKEKRLPPEEDPMFVIPEMAREMGEWLVRLGAPKRDLTFFADALRSAYAGRMDPERRVASATDIEWIDYCCEGADVIAALHWVMAKEMLKDVLDHERLELLNILSPMNMDEELSEFILSVPTADEARLILSKCGTEMERAIAARTGKLLNVMLWDDELGIWNKSNAA
ncbi:MAG: hypothetical protein OXI16_14035 [Chloroflexota bacterium]|nr:hypothetical protein [Chloroflexota bacterium]